MKRRLVGLVAVALLLAAALVVWWPPGSPPENPDPGAAPRAGVEPPTSAGADDPAAAQQPPARPAGAQPLPGRTGDDDQPEPSAHPLELRGLVLTRNGGAHAPVVGATVSVDGERRDQATLKTDAQGAFAVTAEPSTFRALRVEAPGFLGLELTAAALEQSRAVDRAVGAAAAPMRLFLEPGRQVSGRVTALGRALGQAQVRCVQRGMYNTSSSGSSVVSDEQGQFTVTCGLAAGGFKVVATHPDYRRGVTDWLEGPPVSVDLSRGVRLRGKVFDPSGQPAEGATVSLDFPDRPHYLHQWEESRVALPRPTQTDEGEFEFEPVLGKLLVVAEGRDGTRAELPVTLEGDGERSIELTLQGGDHVAGMVTLNGQPEWGVTVGWRCGDRPSLWPKQRTDHSGAFRLNQLKSTGDCFVVAEPELGDRFLGTQVPARIGDENLRLALTVGAPGSLQIAFAGSFPDYSGEFTLTPSDQSNGTNAVRKTSVYFPKKTVPLTALPPGRYRLTAKLSDGKAPAPVEVDVSPGVETSVTLTVPDGFARGQATGRVVDAATGQPLPGADASFEDGKSVLMGKTAADGTFSYQYAAERVALTVGLPGYERRRIELAVGAGQSAALGDVPLKKN